MDADDRAAMTKDEREKRAAKKRREDPNPERKGKAKIVTEGKEDKARRSELAKKHGLDMTKPGSRAKLARLMKADTISKKRKESGDVRTDKEVRKDNAINRKEIDKERQALKQSKTKKGTEARRRVDKKLDDFRRELRSSDKPAEAPPTRQKVNVKVGTKVDKPADGPKTGRNKPTAEKRADRKSYETQQRRNQKELTEKQKRLDIVQNAKVYKSVKEAVEDCELVLGTSARDRTIPWPTLKPKEAAQEVSENLGIEKIAIVFGREDRGLTNEELGLCNLHINIPSDPEYSSLNLSQAVQIIAYEIRMALLEDENRADDWDVERATNQQTELLIEHMDELMKEVDFYDVNNPRKLLVRVRRFFKRSRIDVMENK